MFDPRPYDLTDPAERFRLLCECRGYLEASQFNGTSGGDREGRQFAIEALEKLIDERKPIIQEQNK